MASPGPTPPGPRELTGIVDLTRGKEHPTARLLDLVPGRSGTVYKNWLAERGEDFRAGVRIATLDPFQGYKNAIDDQNQDATSMLDSFCMVKLAGDAPGLSPPTCRRLERGSTPLPVKATRLVRFTPRARTHG